MGGGGANSLNSPETGDNSDFEGDNEDPENDENNEEEYVVTYKTYDDYFTDLNITKETITEEDLTGSGSANNPYIVHNTKGFLYLTNKNVSGIDLSYKYLELDSDVILNDETFDGNGTPSGGDGVVYSWEPIQSYMLSLDGKGNTISNYYLNDTTREEVGLFCAKFDAVQNLKLKDFYLCGKQRVSSLSPILGAQNLVNNITIASGTIKGLGRLYGLCNAATTITNCKNYATIKQIEEGAIKEGVSGLVGQIVYAQNCKNYGNIVANTVSYVGGIATSALNGKIENCHNFGKIEKKNASACTGVGGILGYAQSAKILNCENYGIIENPYGVNGGICGYLYSITSYFYNCKNFGSVERGGGICGYGVSSDIIACENYGKMINSSGIFITMEGGSKSLINNALVKDCVVDCIFVYTGTTQGVLARGVGNIDFINCKVKANIQGTTANAYSLITSYNRYYRWNFKLLNIELDFEVTNNTFYLFYQIWGNADVKLEDSIIKISGVDVRLVAEVGGFLTIERVELFVSSKTNCIKINNNFSDKIKIKSIYIEETINKSISNVNMIVFSQYDLIFENIIRKINIIGSKKQEYYGTDFSGFYTDWKTGKIGLKALSGKGFYQGNVTEELLEQKGFVRKVM